MDQDEPMEEWARRREEHRDASKGKLRALPLTAGPHRGAHVDLAAPRVIQRWTGTQWEVVSIVDDLDTAKALLYPPQPAEAKPAEWDRPALGKGRGQHHKPTPAEDQDR